MTDFASHVADPAPAQRRRNRIRRAELGFWAVALAAALAIAYARTASQGAHGPTQADGPFASDVDGAIGEMNIHFTRETADLTVDSYSDLFKALGPAAHVHVAVQDAPSFELFRQRMTAAGVGDLARFEPLIMEREISTWSRDRYVPRTGTPRCSLLVPAAPTDDSSAQRRGDWFVPWTLANRHAAQYRLDEVQLRFDGGDMVVAHGVLFCDSNLLGKNVPDVFPTRDALLEWLTRTSGLKVELIGEKVGDVPEHHIGMYISPLPDGRVLVADARPDDDPANPGHPVQPAAADAMLRAVKLPARFSPDFEKRCDYVADWLIARGYDVLRMPIFACEDSKVFITWNNVLCETRKDDGKLHVCMPVYGTPPWDARGRAVWESVGAVVHEVRVRKIFVHRGSVRCLTQVLRRD
ncbi:MAG: hypothetical protein AB7K09_02835 [Planctomycetota bacterium]